MRDRGRQDARALGKTHQIRDRGQAKLLHDASAMHLDRLLRCLQFRRDLLVQQAENDEAQNFKFARRQFIDLSRALASSRRACAGTMLACSKARSTASMSSASSKGFSKKSTAPFFIACVQVGTSLWPVMKTICSHAPRDSSTRCKSSPFTPGIRTSRTRHAGPWKSFPREIIFRRSKHFCGITGRFEQAP